MGTIIIFIIAFWEPSVFFEAAIIAIVSVGLVLGITHASYLVLTPSIMISIGQHFWIPLIAEDADSGLLSVLHMVEQFGAFLEVVSYLLLTFIAVLSFIVGRKPEDSLYQVLKCTFSGLITSQK